MTRIRTKAAWLATGLVLGGGAFAMAGAPIATTESPKPTPPRSARAGEVGADKLKPARARTAVERRTPAGERKRNHGFYVSRAAHCQDVSDPARGLSFTAPANCETDGAAKGDYVGKVARSDIGKKEVPAE